MTWFSSADVTRFAAGHRQLAGQQGIDGRYYYDVSDDLVDAARAAGLVASGAPPSLPAPPAWADEMTRKMEAQFAQVFPGAAPAARLNDGQTKR